ncbi:MAG: hypothetical protein JO144_00470 [Actinobacteria bacterium]|nr:hypothetical protein [Actinomycetota bacterium]
MRRVAVLLAVLAPLGLLTACSPAVTAVSAIGYDSRGRLVGALKVCRGHFSEVHLAPSTPDGDAPDIGSWHRGRPLRGTESWPLRDPGAGPWTLAGPVLPELAPGTAYVFWTNTKNWDSRSDYLFFHGSDLAALRPGQVLVRREDPTQSPDEGTARLEVIPLSKLADERCGY